MAEQSEEIEELQLALESDICGLSKEDLIRVAQHLKVNTEGLSRLQITKRIREKVESDLENSEDKKTLLQELSQVVGVRMPPLELEIQDDLVSHDTNENLQEQVEVDKQPTPKLNTPEAKVSVDIAKAFKRDFKIFGTIGGDSHKDSLSFVSLMRQIDTGTKNGYNETEIIEAVIRSVSPSLKLRSYLEMTSGLSLARLKQILRAHFKEKSATELYQELAQLCQGPKESAQDFLIRAMNLREQVIFSSQAVESTVKYSASLVQSLFIHVIETGLQQESVRAKLRPLLEKPSVNDEELMEKVNLAVSAETERQSKMGVSSKKNIQVNQVYGSDCTLGSQNPKEKKNSDANQVKECKPNKLVAALEAVQSDLASLKEAFNNSQKSGRDTSADDRRSPRKSVLCQGCKDSGETKCPHCYKCGSTEHYARGCKKSQGNGKRLRPGDRE